MVSSDGRSVLVTGATGGFGRVVVLRLAGAGWDVVAGARDRDKARDLVAEAAGRGLAVRTVQLDVADAESCRQAVAECAELRPGQRSQRRRAAPHLVTLPTRPKIR